jgi:hypothetical protein
MRLLGTRVNDSSDYCAAQVEVDERVRCDHCGHLIPPGCIILSAQHVRKDVEGFSWTCCRECIFTFTADYYRD